MTVPGIQIEIVDGDLERPEHQAAICEVLDSYARDPMAAGRPLDKDVRDKVVPFLRGFPTAVILLAFDWPRPVGVATCFLGFSTFAARRLLNLHDFAVVPAYRGRGIGRKLLSAVEDKARALDCCKVTLEVFETNPARRLYESCGYGSPDFGNDVGRMLFLAKEL